MSITPDAVKATLRLWASGVTIVTTATPDHRAGTTASSFTSVSMEPPLILVCLYHGVEITKQIEANGHFAVSILGDGQSDLSTQMAGFSPIPEGEDRFYGFDWHIAATGSPIYSEAAGWLDCKLHTIYDGSTHKIIVGEVVATGRSEQDTPPLIYFNRGYRQIKPEV